MAQLNPILVISGPTGPINILLSIDGTVLPDTNVTKWGFDPTGLPAVDPATGRYPFIYGKPISVGLLAANAEDQLQTVPDAAWRFTNSAPAVVIIGPVVSGKVTLTFLTIGNFSITPGDPQ